MSRGRPVSVIEILSFASFVGPRKHFGQDAILRPFHLAYEAVTTARQSLNPARFSGGIGEAIAQPLHRGIQGMIEIHKGVIGPEFLSKLFPRHHFSGTFEQDEQNLEGLLPHLHFRSELPQFAGAQIECIRAE